MFLMRPPTLPPGDIRQEIARQAALLRREAVVRIPSMTLGFAISLLFLPNWVVGYCAAVVLVGEIVVNSLDARPERMNEPWRHRAYLLGVFVLELGFGAPAAMMWHIEGEYVKAFALGMLLCSLLHIATVRSIHLPMGLAGSAAVALLTFVSNTLYWLPRHDIPALALTTLCALVAQTYALGAILLTNRLHRETAAGRAEALTANATKDRFLAQMSHELRTPLNAILGMGHAELRRTDDPVSRERLSVLIRSAEGLSIILDDILDMSAVQQGRMPIRPATVSPRDEITTSVELFRPLIEEAGLSLQVQLTALPARARLDPQRLRQCLSNLLSNALKFTSNGRIRVEAGMEGTRLRPILRIEVSDTGDGIPPGQLEAIFEPFTRKPVAGADWGRVPGNGLGLSISRALARQMGGDLRVLPPQGRGARFALTLALDPVPGAPAADPAPTLPVTGLAGRHVLVVDDIATNRLVASTYLHLFGIRTIEAASGRLALEEIQRHQIDAVLLDMNMPEMDGVETFRRIRALPGPTARVPVIAMTADAMDEQRESYLSHGIDGYIAKPVTPERIAAELARALHLPCPPATSA